MAGIIDRLEFENGRLVKVDGMRPDYMDGNKLIRLVKDLGEALGPAAARIVDLIEANNRFEQEGRNWRVVEKLRADEGSTVTIVADNGDFCGPQSMVCCCGPWTDWEERSITGDTVADALGQAIVAYEKWKGGA